MTDKIRERIDGHIKWLEGEIAECKAKSFTETAKGREYVDALEASLSKFRNLKQ